MAALTAHRQWEKLAALCRAASARKSPRCPTPTRPRALERALAGRGLPTRVLAGEARAGRRGALPRSGHGRRRDRRRRRVCGPTLAAARAGKRILLANKEALVIGGAAFMAAVETGRRDAAADRQRAQCDLSVPSRRVTRAIPRRPACAACCSPRRAARSARGRWRNSRRSRADEACAHPNWVMGRKISVDSATMMNKGLEMIEAHWLFGVPRERIEVVIHPESVVHSLVEYVDGSVLAQLGNPDMRTPIAQALAFPRSHRCGRRRARPGRARARSTFEAPDLERFPCLGLALRGARAGRHGAGRAERGERNRRGRVPRRAHPLHRHRAGVRRGARAAARRGRCDTLDDALAADARGARASRARG